MNFSYKLQAHEIEKQMQAFWSTLKSEPDPGKKPYYVLEAFPYPSGAGLHIGHPLGYIAGDIYSRFTGMQCYNVLHPFGFDSFGLPAEQFAIKTGQHPRITTEQNISNFIKQLKVLNLSYDWDRMVSTCDPEYYKWTQWIFLKLYESFFDQTETWEDGHGHTLDGRAKPISTLVEYLKKGTWHIDGDGVPRPGKSKIKHTEEEIQKSLDKVRLAYLGHAEVNWCPGLGTVLANEEVTKDKKSERGNFPVEKRIMKQWMLRITDYADRLVDGLDTVDWQEQTVAMQKNWIGRSVGMEITFQASHNMKVFTTRPDTILGVTFICVSEDYPIYGEKLPVSEDKIGKFTGHYAKHPITGDKIPIWVGNYVLSGYGSGAVMGVPAHDERDFEFAQKYNLAIKPALMPPNDWLIDNLNNADVNDGVDLQKLWLNDPTAFSAPFCGDGTILNAEQLGLDIKFDFDNKDEVMEDLEVSDIGRKRTTYRLRDWVFSRQRYWGEPIPMVSDEHGNVYPLDESELPLILPDQVDFSPPIGSDDPVAPLSRCTEWIKVQGIIKDGKVITKLTEEMQKSKKVQTFYREANTMPNWAGSSWYYLRYLDPHNDKELVGQKAIQEWCANKNLRYLDPHNEKELIGKKATQEWCADKYATVDLYIIGAEHTVLHLLYARFWHLFLFDIGVAPNPEPWQRMIHQGMITANAYTDVNGQYVNINDVEVDRSNGTATQKSTGQVLNVIQGKMGKSYKNGIPPEEICEKYSTDVFRLHLMYMAPVEQTREWSSEPIVGMERFCQNLCRIVENAIKNNLPESSLKVKIKLNQVIKSVTQFYESFHINTAISSMIECCNLIQDDISLQDCLTLLTLLAPCAPHLAEYWYQAIKDLCESKPESILSCTWPKYDKEIMKLSKVKVPIQINNKLKFVLEVEPDITDEDLKEQIVDKLDHSLDKYKVIIVRKEENLRTVNLVP